MTLCLKNARHLDAPVDLLIRDGRVLTMTPAGHQPLPDGCDIFEADGLLLMPSFIDVHAHFRDPGYEYKEDVVTGLAAAAHGGFGAVMCMANTRPVNDTAAVTRYMLEKARTAWPHGPRLYPVAAATVGLAGQEMAPLGELKEAGCVAVSNDGCPVSSAEMLRRVLAMGIPSGVQNAIISLANVVVQSSINLYGAMAMAGCGAYAKIEGFAFLPINAFVLALAMFIGQNLGAGEHRRARRGAAFGIVTCMALAELIGVAFYLLAPRLIALFNADAQVVAFGTQQARTITLFYFLLALSHAVAGVMRGAGRPVVPMLVMLVCWCLIRVSYILLAARPSGEIQMIFWAYPLTWGLSSLAFLIYYFRADWPHYLEKKSAARV